MKRLLLSIVALTASLSSFAATYPYQDASLTPEQRADDLITRLNVEQKVSLMVHRSEPVPEFGIHYYGWWNEALHGCARAGLATVFPQAIGMAASWDEALLEKVFTVASEEQRLKYIRFRKGEVDAKLYHGLTVWTPNINIFRDPRWGRGQETYLYAFENIILNVPVKNCSDRDGDEVVQAYVRRADDVDGPKYSLRGFKRVNIKAKEKALVRIPLGDMSLSDYNEHTEPENLKRRVLRVK